MPDVDILYAYILNSFQLFFKCAYNADSYHECFY